MEIPSKSKNEEDLGEVFNEKLYVRKRTPLKENYIKRNNYDQFSDNEKDKITVNENNFAEQNLINKNLNDLTENYNVINKNMKLPFTRNEDIFTSISNNKEFKDTRKDDIENNFRNNNNENYKTIDKSKGSHIHDNFNNNYYKANSNLTNQNNLTLLNPSEINLKEEINNLDLYNKDLEDLYKSYTDRNLIEDLKKEENNRKVTFDEKIEYFANNGFQNNENSNISKDGELAMIENLNNIKSDTERKQNNNEIDTLLIDDKKKAVLALEEEFNKMIKINKNTLKMKSKLYQFIYSELNILENKYYKEIKELEKKVLELNKIIEGKNKEIEEKDKKIESYKEYIKNFQKMCFNKIMSWKSGVENTVRNYIKTARSVK